ncbi:MAG TPA: hypothetical protein VGG61_11145, partial [Gemmataceae bacterium]
MPRRQRVFVVRRAEAGRPLADLLRSHFHLTPKDVDSLLQSRCVWVNGRPCADRKWRVLAGQRVRIKLPDAAPPRPQPPPAGPLPVVRYVDECVVVVGKPAGLTTVRHAEEAAEYGARARKFLPPTLADLLPQLLARKHARAAKPVRAVHRIDK